MEMPEDLIREQATECITYSIAVSLNYDKKKQDELSKGLLQVYAEAEGVDPE